MKKIIATILALCMILGLAGVANAEATTLTMWTFIAQHQEFYESMAKLWNEQNPDRQIDLQALYELDQVWTKRGITSIRSPCRPTKARPICATWSWASSPTC